MNVPPGPRPFPSEAGVAVTGAPERVVGEPIGLYLASHRRLRGISLDDLSQQTRIPLRSLERLESGSFDGQADGFVRGFVRTVAIALGLDADETVSRLRSEPGALGRRPIGRLSLVRVSVTVALVVAACVLFALGRAALDRVPESLAVDEPTMTMRRDPVRTLAESQAVGRTVEQSTVLAAVPGNPGDTARSSAAAPVPALESAVSARETPGAR